MKAMVLAAGRGERLRPHTDRLPKPLFPVLGVPLIRIVLVRLRQAGVQEVVVNLHHLPAAIVRALGNGRDLGLRLEYSEEPILLGTGGGLRAVADFFQGEEAFFLHNGDVLAEWDLGSLWEAHRQSAAVATLALDDGQRRSEARLVEVDREGRVVGVRGRPREGGGTRWVFTGVSVWTPRVLEVLPRGEVSCLVEQGLIPLLEKGERVMGVPMAGGFSDIGTEERLFEAQWEILPRAQQWFEGLGLSAPREVAPGVFLQGEVRVHSSVHLEGPVFISEGCRIEEGSVLGPRAVLGPCTVVQARSHVHDALVTGRGTVGGAVTGIVVPEDR